MSNSARTIALLWVVLSLGCAEAGGPARIAPRPDAPAPGLTAPPALRLSGDVRPLRYAVDLTIVPAQPRFRGRISIAAEATREVPIVWLNATGLTIARASLNGQAAQVVEGNEDFVGLRGPVARGALTIEMEYEGAIDREKSRGIYAVPEGEDWYAYTMFEPLDARRAFPCFDQPDAKVPWRLTFHVKREHVALANAPVETESDEGNGMKKVVMAESLPLPSYLVAFVVGPFDLVDGGTAGRVATPIRFIVPKGRGGALGYARAVTPRVVSALEDYFDMDYPYRKLDVAVVPRFWGTMEHPGIVAMGQPLTLIERNQETRSRKEWYANILAHELAHYWFGDLVTLAWWDDTWLNEALAEWMDPIITDRAEPDWKFFDSLTERMAYAMLDDESVSSKAIYRPVDSREAIQASFDNTITYFKGSAVLRMFEIWVGQEKWRRFIRAYLKAHAWGNAKAADFFAAMERQLGEPVATAFRTFIDQPGVPLIEHEVVCGGSPRLELTQRRAMPAGATEDMARTWQVPVCVRYGAGKAAYRSCSLMSGPAASLPLEGGCPTWLVMNAGGVGYYRSGYTKRELVALLSPRSPARPTVPERRVLLMDAGAAVGRDRLSIAEAMAMVPLAMRDSDERIQRAAWDLIEPLRYGELGDDARARYKRWVLATWGPIARKLGWRRRPGDSDDRHFLRATALTMAAWAGDGKLRAAATRLARSYLADRSAVEDDMVVPVLGTAARVGGTDLFDALVAAAGAEGDRRVQRRMLRALGQFHDPALLGRAFQMVLSGDFDLRESASMLYAAMNDPETRDQAWAFIEKNVDQLLGRMRHDEAAAFIGSVAGVFCDQERRRAAASLFAGRTAAIDGARHSLDQALAQVDRCIATQARIAPDALEFLRAQ